MDNAHKPSTNREPVKIFKSKALEFFTHIHPGMVLAIWVPIIGVFIYLSGVNALPGVFPWYAIGAFVLGLFVWTLAEYVLHRWLFHYEAKSEAGKRITFIFHGVHHLQPMVKSRLVMPPMVSLPLGAIFFGLYYLVFVVILRAPHWLYPTFAGFATGYLVYDMIHYSVHHFNLKGKFFKWVRKHHMEHHVQTPDERFGVTSPTWDYVFQTEPTVREKKEKQKTEG